MSANTNPVYLRQAPLATGTTAIGQVSAANTNRDGTGTLVTIMTASADGALVEGVIITAIVTTTAGMVRLYQGDGTNDRLIAEISVDAITPTSVVKAFTATYLFPRKLWLAGSDLLKASTHNAEAMNVHVIGDSGHF